jgi:uncharacterized peroxidase-related enzyme
MTYPGKGAGFMAFINVISPGEASGRLQGVYQRVQSADGQVDNVLQVHSLRPHTLEGHMAIYKAVLHHSHNRLPEWYLEAIGVLVSHLNGCGYCKAHHSEGLRRLLQTASLDFNAYIRALGKDKPGEPFTTREQSGLSYARKLTQSPGQIEQKDINDLRDAGFVDGEILEINQVSAYFAYANRTVSGLGVNTEGEILGQSPTTGDDDSGWSHSGGSTAPFKS